MRSFLFASTLFLGLQLNAQNSWLNPPISKTGNTPIPVSTTEMAIPTNATVSTPTSNASANTTTSINTASFLVAKSEAPQENKTTDLPDNPKSGKCYIKCITTDEFQTKTESIVINPAYKKLKIIPGVYQLVPKQVMVKEASKKLVLVPAVYETVEESYSSAETQKSKVIPAKFKDDVKTIETSPRFAKWEYKTLKNCPSANKEACMTACYVEYPAKQENVSLSILDQDATVVQENLPGKAGSYRKQRVKTPARVEEIEIPAEYATIKVSERVRPDSVVEENVPAVSKTITVTELVKKGGMTVWEEVECEIAQGAIILPILYEYNSSKLTEGSVKIIDEKLLTLMNQKPNLKIQIGSHTDSRGNAGYNLALSQKRAQAVVSYLVSKGIASSRLVAKGYGKTKLKNRCDTGVECSEKEHQENRRTEFSIMQ